MLLKCEGCGKTFRPGTNKEGLPNGVGFETKSGSFFTICTECVNASRKKFQRCMRGDNDDNNEFI